MASLKLAEGKKAEARAILNKFPTADLSPMWKSRFEKLQAKIKQIDFMARKFISFVLRCRLENVMALGFSAALLLFFLTTRVFRSFQIQRARHHLHSAARRHSGREMSVGNAVVVGIRNAEKP